VRFDLLPVTRAMWRRRGRRLLVHTPGKNVRVAVCGALRYPKGPFLFTHGPKSVNTDLFIALLNKLVRRAKRTGKRIMLVLDNGGCFTSKRSSQALHAARRWVTPIFLPKYTSESLNWIEGFWGHTKDTFFSRMLTKKRDSFYDEAVRRLQQLRRPGTLRTLLRPARRPLPPERT
jgi:transposase